MGSRGSSAPALGEGTLSGEAIQLVLMLAVLSLAPGILMTITLVDGRALVAGSLAKSFGSGD